MNFVGQWIGALRTDGIGEAGVASLSIEKDQSELALGCISQGAGIPPGRVWLKYQVAGDAFTASNATPPEVFDPATLRLVAPAEHPRAKDFTYSLEIKVEGRIDGGTISGTWSGNSGAAGTCHLVNVQADATAPDHTLSWSEFSA